MRCALALHSENPEYVWRRIRAVSLEEISIADLQLVAQVLAVAGKRSLQQKIGERALLSLLTARLATAPKCRTACDLLVWLPQAPKLVEDMQQPEFDAAALLASEAAYLRHTAELWHSIAPRSIRTRSGWAVVSRGDARKRDAWLEEAGVPPLVRYIVERGSNTDALNVLLVPAYQLAQCGAQRLTSPSSSCTSLENIGGVPAYAYCIFSEPGRAALRRFLSANEKWRRLFDESGVHDPIRALGYLAFYAEGGYCSEILSVSRSSEIKLLSEIASLERFGVPGGQVQNFQQKMSADLPLLNASRRATVGVKA